MDESIQHSLKELGHHVSCLYTSSGEQLDDIFRLQHLLPYSKFINDMRGVSINLTNFFSSYVPLLDSFVIGPKNSLSTERTTSYSDKITVAELLSISKSDETISSWMNLRDKFAKVDTTISETEDFVRLAESHNDIIQELVDRTYEFDRPQKYSEANNSIKFGTNRARINKGTQSPTTTHPSELQDYIQAVL